MTRSNASSRPKKFLHAVLTAVLVVTGLVAVPQLAAAAGPVVVTGTVSADANNDGQLTVPAVAGREDRPLGGVPVSLVCATDGLTLATVSTTATGAYEFGTTDVKTCTSVKVRINVAGYAADQYATQATSSANQFGVVGGDPTIAETAPFAPSSATPVVSNALVHPAWRSNLVLVADPAGMGGLGVRTGAEPWDTLDGSTANDVVRTGDLVTYNWYQTFSQSEPRGTTATDLVFEQILDLSPTAVANFSSVPATCSGTTPNSGILAKPSNTAVAPGVAPPAGTTQLILTCNLGPIGQATAGRNFTTNVWVSSTSQNGATYNTTARMYGVDDRGAATIQPTQDIVNGPVSIVAQPRYDLAKTYFRRDSNARIIDGVSTLGYDIKFWVTISQDRQKGVEAAAQPITFTDNFWGQYGQDLPGHPRGSTTDGLRFYLVGCDPALMTHGDGKVPGGRIGYNNGTAENSVPNSGTCSYTRQSTDPSAAYDMTITGADLSGSSFPTRAGQGGPVPANTYYLTSHLVTMFVPLSEISRFGGAIDFKNMVSKFEPKSPSGAFNFGDTTGQGEPGYCQPTTPTSTTSAPVPPCKTMPTGTRSNNVADSQQIILAGAGNTKGNVNNVYAFANTQSYLPNSGGYHDGSGTVQPAQAFGSRVSLHAGDMSQSNIGVCDIIDVSVAKFAPVNRIISTNNSGYAIPDSWYSYVVKSGGNPDAGGPNAANYQAQIALQQSFRIEYAHVPISGDTANNGTLDLNDNRYQGTWTSQAAATCRDDSPVDDTWYSSPEQVPGGLDAANAVRAVGINGYVLGPGYSLNLWVSQEMRDTFNGGPRAGETIPSGTIAADFARFTSTESNTNWASTRAYYPQPHKLNQDGDRVALTRALMSIRKSTVVAKNMAGQDVGAVAAGVGESKSTVAGNQVVFKLVSTLTAPSLTNPAPVNNATITDTLPRYVTYNEACTASLVGGTPATTVTPNADGTTTLVFQLGTIVPNQPIADRLICTDTDQLAPHLSRVENKSEIRADEVAFNAASQRSNHTVILEQDGRVQLRKDVDQTLDLEDADQGYTLSMRNFSETLEIATPTVIDVLSYNGDATNDANLNRSPESNYAGSNKLTAAPKAFNGSGTTPIAGTFYYTTKPGAEVPQDLNNDTDPAIWSTTFTPDATAFKFVAAVNLGAAKSGDGAGIVIKYTTDQADNDPGDLYANRYTFFSPTLVDQGKFTKLTSNQTTVRVVGFSIGDFIWIDEDGSGTYTAGVDTPAPEGVTVEVYNLLGFKVGETTTTDTGRWIVHDLPVGSYYAVIPASEFSAGALLAGLVPAPGAVADPSNNANEDVDHHAVAAVTGGVRTSGVITFAASRDASGNLIGNGPLGDNVANLALPPMTTDSFTNLTVDFGLARVPGYEFTKSAEPASKTPVQVGESVTYTLSGSNTGGAPLEVTIGDDLAEVLAYADLAGEITATIDGAAADAPVLDATNLSWTGSLAAGQTVEVTYTVTVKEGTEGKTLKNLASSTAKPPFGEDITPPPVTTEHPIPGYTFTKVADPATGTAVTNGDVVTYTLTGTNTGATVLDPVVINDDLSAVLNNADLVTGSLKAEINGVAATAPTLSGTDLNWTGALKVGETVVVTYQVTVATKGEPATLKNLATSEATPPGIPPIIPPEVTTEHPVPAYAFTKTSDPVSGSDVFPGESITYTLTGKNAGATPLEVTIADDLTKVLEFATLTTGPVASVGDATLEGSSLAWSGTLAAGESVTITYAVQVNAGAEGKILNNVASSTATPPGLPPLDVPPVETSHPVPGYAFNKVADPVSGTDVQPTDTVTYTVTGTNTGATPLDVVVTDDLSQVLDSATITTDPAASIVSAAGESVATAPVVNGTTLEWSGELAVGESVVITYTVTVDAGTEGKWLKNVANSTATTPDGDPINPDEVSTTHPIPGYTFTKVADPESGKSVQPNDIVTYTLTGTNTGATELDVTVTDNLAEVLAYADLVDSSLAASVGDAPTVTDTTLTWAGKLAVGESVVITYQVKVKAGTAGETLHNTAVSKAKPPFSEEITPPEVSTEHPIPGYEFTKVADPISGTDVQPGDEVTYTLTGTNTGATNLTVSVADDLTGVLAHAELIDGPTASAGDATLDGVNLGWTGELAPGESIVITYTVKVNADTAGQVLRNSASSSASPPEGEPIVPPTVVTEHPIPGYAFTKAANPASGTAVQPGETVTYTLTGTNTGATSLDVVVSDDLAEVLAYADLTGVAVATVGDATVAAPTLDGTTLNWNGALAVGESVVITYTVTVKADTAGNWLLNKANSTAKPPFSEEITPPEVSTTHPIPGYEFAKTADPTSGTDVQPGDVITYTLTGSNTGATDLTVSIGDDLTEVLAYADLTMAPSASQGMAPVLDGNVLSWNGTLAAGESVEITYAVTVKAGTAGSAVRNSATSVATPPEGPEITPPPVVTEHPVPGYAFTKTADPASGSSVQPGDVITYTLTGTNTGATRLDPVVVTDDLTDVLSGATLVDGSAVAKINGEPASAPMIDGTTLSWTGSLEIGQSIEITYQVTVNEGVAGIVLHNVASSTATPPTGPELTPPPVETEHPTPGFTFTKTADPVSGTDVVAGQAITYTLTGYNNGATVLDPAVITDDLAGVLPFADFDPASMTATVDGAAVAAPVFENGVITWTGALQPGQVVVVTYSVTVKDVAASADNVIRNHATAVGTPPEGPPVTPPTVTTEHPIPGFALDKSANPESGTAVKPGETVAYTVTGTNTGATALDATVSDDLSQVLAHATLVDGASATITKADGSTADAGEVVIDGTKLTWNGALAVGEHVTLNYSVTVNETTEVVTLKNIAVGSYKPPFGPSVTTPPASTEHPVTPTPVVETPKPTPPGTPTIPVTGVAGPAAPLLIGGLLLALGLVLLVRTKRRKLS